MLLFKHKSNSALKKSYIDFLNSADSAYMRAFTIRSVKALHKYMSRDCVVKLSAQIYSGNRYFGAEKFRTTDWTVISESEGIYDLCKSVTFAKVKFTKTFEMSVAVDYKELWRLDTRDSMEVLDIRKLV